MHRWRKWMSAVAVLSVALAVATPLQAGVARSAVRDSQRAAAKSLKRIPAALAKDAARDSRTPARTLSRSRLAFRYVDRSALQREVRRGFAKGTHFTSTAGPGRPLSPLGARLRYGLPKSPTHRESVRLRPGDRVRLNKVVGGNRAGLGEASLAARIPWSRTERVIRLGTARSPLGKRLAKGGR